MSEAKPNFKELIKHMATLFRKLNVNYDQSKYLFKMVRIRNKLKPNTQVKKKRNPLSIKETHDLIEAAYNKNSEHGLIIETLYATGSRNNEFCHIKIENIYFDEFKIHIKEGKGAKERFVPIPIELCKKIRLHISNHKAQTYLFETQRYDKYSTRRINEIVKYYGKIAIPNKRVFPHLIRHSLATHLRESGMPIDRISVILGHADSGVTERVYAKISFSTVNKDYQKIMSNDKPNTLSLIS
jgi:integrase/recombinase XerD